VVTRVTQVACEATVTAVAVYPLTVRKRRTYSTTNKREARNRMGILWIILIVILVLALLGFFSRGYW
jgi:hypothetical protein